jgi:7,8-dihydro-6-hydroxymethylpterin-pyrophosphokinase
VQAVSNAWQSPAQGNAGPDYLNAAVLVDTEDMPSALIEKLKQVERDLGRVAGDRRTIPIDIDLLIYDGIAQRSEVWEQGYCAAPVAELLPMFRSPEMSASLREISRRLVVDQRMRIRPDVFAAMTIHP